MSVCCVTETTLYYRGLPASGGLLDPLMGTVDRRHLCATCMQDARHCQGHPGHIKLAFPVYHIGFVDTVLKALRCVCFACARACVSDEERATFQTHAGNYEEGDGDGDACGGGGGKHRLHALHNLTRTRRTCVHCGMVRPTISRAAFGLRVDWPADVAWESAEEEAYCTAPFTARDALSILRHVPHADLALMGFDPVQSHPQHMIVQNLVVCPPCTRPAVYSSEGSRSRGQNDLTMKYLEILKRSNEVAQGMSGTHWADLSEVTPDLLERLARLQSEVFMMVTSSARVAKPPGMGRNSSNASGKSLQERLKGKEGRVRGNLMGKRVDFSARCVITPDATFECDRVGVPHRIAMNLTVPELVNADNVGTLTRRVRRGAHDVHGALNVVHVDGSLTSLAA